MRRSKQFSAILSGLVLAGGCMLMHGARAGAGVSGPILPYTSFADSPFNGGNFTYFHLETFEEGALTAPGVTASAGAAIGPTGLTDSVDGGGDNGHSFFSGDGAGGVTFTFDKAVLGSLPTVAGIAWTDGELAIHFSAKDANGVSLGTINDSSGHGFSGGDGNPNNYRLFTATNATGISSITISNDSGGIELDHLQYGLAGTSIVTSSVPVPAGFWIGLTGLVLAGSKILTVRSRRA
jgi:hypothetical protein